MANYSLVINSSFKPFSYAEMLAPVMQATQAHQDLENAYSELDTKASIWEKLANSAIDKDAYNIYKHYADDLKGQADELANNGLSLSSRQSLLNMKNRYAREITPIEEAWGTRAQLAEEQRKLRQADTTIRFDRDFRNVSLKDIMDNPNISYESLSGKDIAARTSAIAANYAKTIQSDPQYKSILGSQFWQVRQQSGWTPEQIIMDATGDSKAPETLKRIREQMHESLRENAAYDRDWANSYISQGMHSGLGTRTYSTLENKGYLNALEQEKLNALRRAAAKEKEEKLLDTPVTGTKTVTGDGNVTYYKKDENVPTKGKPIRVRKGSGNTIEVVMPTKKGDIVMARITPHETNPIKELFIDSDGGLKDLEGRRSRGDMEKEFANYFGVHRLFGSPYDADYDTHKLELLSEEILRIVNNEAGNEEALKNYEFLFDPDNSSYSNESGSYTIKNLRNEDQNIHNAYSESYNTGG